MSNPTSHPLPEEAAAAQTIHGLALQLCGLDFRNPMAFERAQQIGDEIALCSQKAVEARGEFEFPNRRISRLEIENALGRRISA
nr:hypothetical protein [uncultured Holophaga sp.]